MRDESIFRLVIAAITLGGISLRIYFQTRANRTGGAIVPRSEPGFWLGVAALAPLMLIPLVAFLINPAWLGWDKIPLPRALRWAGAALALACFPALFSVFRRLGHNLTRTAGFRENAALVTNGPYRYVRHPLYTLGSLMCVGVTLMTSSGLMGVGVVLLMCLLPLRVAAEEAALLERFGAAYREYAARTGRFLPRIWSGNSPA